MSVDVDRTRRGPSGRSEQEGTGAGGPAPEGTEAGGPGPEGADAALARLGLALADAVVEVLPRWVERSVTDLVRAWSGTVGQDELAAARAAAARAVADVGPDLRRLLEADVDAQWTNPMTIVRRAVVPATEALRAAGVGEVQRSADDEARFPDDVYGLTPAAFADLHPSLHELGITWGAVKARAHLTRHRPPAGEGGRR